MLLSHTLTMRGSDFIHCMHRLWKIDRLFDNFICSGKTFQINVPELDKLSLNNSLFGFGVTKLLFEEDRKIRDSLFKMVGSNISRI